MTAQTRVLEVAQPVQDMVTRYVNAMNEVMSLNLDMAFDVMLKNYTFMRSMRSSTDVMVEDLLKGQQRFVTEMVHVAQDYAVKMPDMMTVPSMK
jgi:hypothetical protein